jgi:hypothetical protein
MQYGSSGAMSSAETSPIAELTATENDRLFINANLLIKDKPASALIRSGDF